MSEPEEGDDRRRPGRFRRWIVRPTLWLVAALALLVLAARVFVDSAYFRERARTFLERRVAEYLDRPVAIEALHFRLLPIEVELDGVTLSGPEPGARPVVTVARIFLDVDVDPAGFHRPAVHLDRLRIEQPDIYIEFRPDGSTNLPQLGSGGGGPQRVQVDIGRLEVAQGVLELDEQRLPLELAARGVEATLLGTGGFHLQGRVSGEQVTMTLPGGRPYSAAVDLRLALGDGRLDLLSGHAVGPDLSADLRGFAVWKPDKQMVIQAEADTAGALLSRLGYLEAGLVEGRVHFDGGLAWSPESWGVHGRLRAGSLTLLDRRLTDVAGQVASDRSSLRLDVEHAVYGGGTIAGPVTVDLSQDSRPVELDLQIDGVDVRRILQDQEIPITGVGGLVTGVFNYRFPAGAAKEGDGWGELGIAPAGGSQGLLALSGTVPLAIHHGVFSTDAVRLTSSRQRVLAQGSYDLAQGVGRFDYQVTTESLPELARLLPEIGAIQPPPAWLPDAGSGELDGRLYIDPRQVATDVRADLRDVVAPGLHADELSGNLQVGKLGIGDLHLLMRRDDAHLTVEGSVPFPANGAVPAAAPALALSVQADAWPLVDAAAWVPFPLAATGPFSGTVALGGGLESLRGRVSGRVDPLRFEDIDIGTFEASFAFDPETVHLESAALTAPAGQVQAAGTLHILADTVGLDLEADSTTLVLDRPPLDAFVPQALDGQMALTAHLGGTLLAPEVDVRVAGENLVLAGRPLGKDGTSDLHAVIRGGELAAEGSFLGLARLSGSGRVADGAVDLDLALASDDLGRWVDLVSPQPVPDLTGTVAGHILVQGSLEDLSKLAVEVRLDRLAAEYRGHHLVNQEPVVVQLDQNAVRIASFYVGEPDTTNELFVAGTVGLEQADHPLDLHLQGEVDLAWLRILMPQVQADGELQALAVVRGTLAEPAVSGQGEIRDARVILEGFPQSVDHLDAVVLLYPKQVVIDSLSADFAGGTVQASGSLDLVTGGGAPSYRLQAAAKDLSLHYPEGWVLRGGAEAVLTGSGEGRLLRGSVHFDRVFYVRDVKLGLTQLLQRFFQRRRLEVEQTSELMAATQLNVVIEGDDALRVRNNLADLRGSIDLAVRGTLARPVVFGTVSLQEGGSLVYSGNEYTIERAELNFANPYQIEPLVDLVATTEIRNYDVTLNLSGSLDRLNATFASEPPLADLQVLSLLTTGQQSEEVGVFTPGQAGPSQGFGAEGFLYGQAATLVAQRANTLFGLDKFQIDPLTNTSGSLSSARVTVGKQLSKDVAVTYSYDPSENKQEILQVEWQINRSLALVATQNGDGSYAVDARWESVF